MTILNSSLLLALGQLSQHLSHGLPVFAAPLQVHIQLAVTWLSYLSWQLHIMPVGKGTKHIFTFGQ